MSRFRILLTDYAWPDLEIERRILAEVDGELVVAADPSSAALADLAASAAVDGVMTTWAQVPAAVIDASPRCAIVARFGIGLDNIDVDHCTRRGIVVTNVPDYCTLEVAEHALALLLSLARKVAFYHHETKVGRYELQAGPELRRLAGQTLGIVGLGRIGRRVAELARAMGLHVIAATRSGQTNDPRIEACSLDELLARSDYVSLHLPLADETRHLIGAAQLSQMKPTAYLINTARGGLIDHAALADALQADAIAGAALDVQDPEPPDLSRPPYNDPRVVVTPHAAFVSAESVADLRRRAARQVAERLSGGVPENVVNRSVLATPDDEI